MERERKSALPSWPKHIQTDILRPVNPIKLLRRRTGLTQDALAQLAGTSQPTIAAYESGRKSPTLTTAARLARAVGLEMVVDFLPPLTREDRRSLALHDAVIDRLLSDPEAVIERAHANLDLMLRVNPNAAPLLNEWRVLLGLPLPHLVDVLRDPSPHARELRHTSPFAGVLSAPTRARVYRAFAESERRIA